MEEPGHRGRCWLGWGVQNRCWNNWELVQRWQQGSDVRSGQHSWSAEDDPLKSCSSRGMRTPRFAWVLLVLEALGGKLLWPTIKNLCFSCVQIADDSMIASMIALQIYSTSRCSCRLTGVYLVFCTLCTIERINVLILISLRKRSLM